jgi:hypothetical protein
MEYCGLYVDGKAQRSSIVAHLSSHVNDRLCERVGSPPASVNRRISESSNFVHASIFRAPVWVACYRYVDGQAQWVSVHVQVYCLAYAKWWVRPLLPSIESAESRHFWWHWYVSCSCWLGIPLVIRRRDGSPVDYISACILPRPCEREPNPPTVAHFCQRTGRSNLALLSFWLCAYLGAHLRQW